MTCSNCKLLRKALLGLVGSDDPKELEEMEAVVRTARIPEKDRVNTLNAIYAIQATTPEAGQ